MRSILNNLAVFILFAVMAIGILLMGSDGPYFPKPNFIGLGLFFAGVLGLRCVAKEWEGK